MDRNRVGHSLCDLYLCLVVFFSPSQCLLREKDKIINDKSMSTFTGSGAKLSFKKEEAPKKVAKKAAKKPAKKVVKKK